MREDRIIERELEVAREDLESRLTELREVLHEKLDIKKRVRAAIVRPVQARPLAAVAIAFGLGALAGFATTRRRP